MERVPPQALKGRANGSPFQGSAVEMGGGRLTQAVGLGCGRPPLWGSTAGNAAPALAPGMGARGQASGRRGARLLDGDG